MTGIVFSLSLSFLSGFAGPVPVLWFWLRLFFVGFCFCLSKTKKNLSIRLVTRLLPIVAFRGSLLRILLELPSEFSHLGFGLL